MTAKKRFSHSVSYTHLLLFMFSTLELSNQEIDLHILLVT